MAKAGRKILFRLEDVKMHFPVKKENFFKREARAVKAVDGVTLDIFEGETLGLVGESGCGKTTLGRLILQLHKPTSGNIQYFGLTLSDYAPQYAFRIVRRVAGLRERNPETLLRAHPEEAALLGGLLLETDRAALSKKLLQRLRVVERFHQINVRLELYKYYQGASNNNKESNNQRKRFKGLQEAAAKTRKELEERDAAIETRRAALSGQPGYELLEGKRSEGVDIARLSAGEMRRLRRYMQIVFQDPYSSLNPRLTMGNIVSEALVAHGAFPAGSEALEKYTLKVMEDCGLQNYMLHRYPHQFSGGQRQRIGIARALALQPKFVVCDEAVSALDVSIQSQIINLLIDLKERNNLTYLFISHDLSTVKFISDRVGVMYLGNMIELGESHSIYADPLHPYTKALLDAIPTTTEASQKELQVLEGDIPSPIDPPSGCKFHTRCRYAQDRCKVDYPEWREYKSKHFVACHFPLDNV